MMSLSEFSQYIRHLFTHLRRSAGDVHSLQWDDIFSVMQYLEQELILTSHFDVFLRHILLFLLEYDCPYVDTIVRLLYLYVLRQNQYFCSSITLLNLRVRRSFLRGIARPWHSLEPIVKELVHPMTTLNVIRKGDLNFMKLLVRNGLSCPNFPGTEAECIYGEKLLARILSDTELGENVRGFVPEILVTIIVNSYLFEGRAISLQRVLMVAWVLEAVRRRRVNLDRDLNYVRCLRLLFDTIAEPFISVWEVQNFLHDIFIAVPIAIQNAICVDVLKIFPESADTYQPRTLLHLSRCKARRSLLGNRPLPAVVNSLHITSSLKPYILAA